MKLQTLILIPVVGISIGTSIFLAVHFLRWLGNLLDTNDTAVALFGIAFLILLTGTLRK